MQHCLFYRFYIRQVIGFLCTVPSILVMPVLYYRTSKVLGRENTATSSSSNQAIQERKASLIKLFGILGVSYIMCFLPYVMVEFVANYSERLAPRDLLIIEWGEITSPSFVVFCSRKLI